ncbi:sensor histidine kinase [Mangrovihabitans endophyticus]|uniref:histidine kinase n=1 Tax=Mangrovihabitans endophyticus TaxID=1751298 RepID=A0A8J3BTM7_9ACTN|nr:histidine kinase [Mangrovihabitans endophyticus]GGK73574.1 two-component sensor histidine kinase [Mangrovihabitans endophyticus]
MLWDEPRPPGAPARVWRDWALVGVLAPAAVLEGVLRTDLRDAPVEVVLALALLPTLLWRRTRPLPMVAIAFLATAVEPLVIGYEPRLTTMAYLLILPYALFRWGSGREAVIGAVVVLLKICLHAAFGYLSAAEALPGFVVMFAAFALASAYRYRARLRARELDRARLLERERLARDLHDTTAHHVSAMAIRAQAGIALAQSTRRVDVAVDALHVIEAEATRALTDMRTLVRALRRAQEADLAPSPGIADIPALASRSAPGPVVEVHLAGDLDDIPSTIGTAVYRLAQESVTNARRHARHATRIEVRVAADDRSVRLRVSDDGDTGGAGAASSGGYGLAGMAERVGLLGGTCEAGPAPDRGWTVTAAIPRAGAAASTPA